MPVIVTLAPATTAPFELQKSKRLPGAPDMADTKQNVSWQAPNE
jgi:hypothetical protein